MKYIELVERICFIATTIAVCVALVPEVREEAVSVGAVSAGGLIVALVVHCIAVTVHRKAPVARYER